MKTVILVLVLYLVACGGERNEPVTYTIKAGSHTSDNRGIRVFKGSSLEFTAVFDSSARYTLPDEDQFDINKLYGFREGVTESHSARIGWNWIGDRIILYPYVHCDGENLGSHDPQPLSIVEIGDTVHCKITIMDGAYRFEANGEIADVQRCADGSSKKYYLYPYFGGNEVAPHDIKIIIQEL